MWLSIYIYRFLNIVHFSELNYSITWILLQKNWNQWWVTSELSRLEILYSWHSSSSSIQTIIAAEAHVFILMQQLQKGQLAILSVKSVNPLFRKPTFGFAPHRPVNLM